MKNIINSIKLIHNGLKTHNQDHVIYSVNFNPTNNTVNKPENPIPDDEVLLLDIPIPSL